MAGRGSDDLISTIIALILAPFKAILGIKDAPPAATPGSPAPAAVPSSGGADDAERRRKEAAAAREADMITHFASRGGAGDEQTHFAAQVRQSQDQTNQIQM